MQTKQNMLPFFLVVLPIFALGVFTGFSVKKTTTKEITKDISVSVDLSDWGKLKDVDDSALSYCSKGFSLLSEWVDAVAAKDSETASQKTKEIKSNSLWIQNTNNQREEILKKLGYIQ